VFSFELDDVCELLSFFDRSTRSFKSHLI